MIRLLRSGGGAPPNYELLQAAIHWERVRAHYFRSHGQQDKAERCDAMAEMYFSKAMESR
jgi:ribonuclease HI